MRKKLWIDETGRIHQGIERMEELRPRLALIEIVVVVLFFLVAIYI